MGDEKHRALICLQQIFQRFLSHDVHVIGGLIQNQQVRPSLKDFTQGQPRLFPAGKKLHLPEYVVLGEQERAKGAPRLRLGQVRKFLPEIRQHILRGSVLGRLLVKIANLHIDAKAKFPAQGRKMSHQGL